MTPRFPVHTVLSFYDSLNARELKRKIILWRMTCAQKRTHNIAMLTHPLTHPLTRKISIINASIVFIIGR